MGRFSLKLIALIFTSVSSTYNYNIIIIHLAIVPVATVPQYYSYVYVLSLISKLSHLAVFSCPLFQLKNIKIRFSFISYEVLFEKSIEKSMWILFYFYSYVDNESNEYKIVSKI